MLARRRGMALATVLLVVFVVLLFALTLATLATSRYQMAAQSAARTRSFEAAQAGLARAMARLSEEPSWGRDREALEEPIGSDGYGYGLTFDPGAGAPWSVNNLRGQTRVAGFGGRVVPPHSAHLMVRAGRDGESPGRQRTLEAVVQFRSFPYAIASDRSVRAGNLLVVNGAGGLGQVLGGERGGAGHIYGRDEVRTGTLGQISGRVVTPGRAHLGLGTIARGGVEEGAEADLMPDIDLARFNNRDWTETVEMASGTYVTPQTLSGAIHVQGDLHLVTGGRLDDAYLFLEGGSLRCDGPLTGTGSIFATGDIQLSALANLVVNEGIAVFAGGDLEVRGLPAGLQFFQGVLYSRREVRLRTMIQVVGAVIGLGEVHLEQQATVVHVPEYTQFGSYWEGTNMRGSVVNGDLPLMKVLFWRESTP